MNDKGLDEYVIYSVWSSLNQVGLRTISPWYKLLRVGVLLVGVDLCRNCLGYKLSWVRDVLGTKCLGHKLPWAWYVLGTSCPDPPDNALRTEVLTKPYKLGAWKQNFIIRYHYYCNHTFMYGYMVCYLKLINAFIIYTSIVIHYLSWNCYCTYIYIYNVSSLCMHVVYKIKCFTSHYKLGLGNTLHTGVLKKKELFIIPLFHHYTHTYICGYMGTLWHQSIHVYSFCVCSIYKIRFMTAYCKRGFWAEWLILKGGKPYDGPNSIMIVIIHRPQKVYEH